MLTVVRTEHRVDLLALTLALYHSNVQMDQKPTVDAVRTAITSVLREHGSDVVVKVADYIHEARSFDGGSLVGSDVDRRLEWARRLVLKAYRSDFKRFPKELEAFEALPVKEIV
ncbi:hypothetical protein ACWGQT_07310 [Streptomyces yangpuensis]